jgi:ankyrin repeat protein
MKYKLTESYDNLTSEQILCKLIFEEHASFKNNYGGWRKTNIRTDVNKVIVDLLNEGADPNYVDSYGSSPLQLAIKKDNFSG